jgi:hypothetical protein
MTARESLEIKYNPVAEASLWNPRIKKAEG